MNTKNNNCYSIASEVPYEKLNGSDNDTETVNPIANIFSTSQQVIISSEEYETCLQYKAFRSSYVALVVQTGNPTTCLTPSSPSGP